jgi:hypothetical protein
VANEKTWYSWVDYALPDTTNVLTTSKSILWCLKAALKGEIAGATLGPAGAVPGGAYWTVYYSCDGAVAGTANDGVDRWGASYDGTKLVRHASAAHSWMVLKSPTTLSGSGSSWYLIIDWMTTLDYQANFILCKTAPTGGTTSARPTATDEIYAGSLSFADSNVWAAGRCHYTVDGAGNFWFFASKNTGAIIQVAHGVQTLKNLRNPSDGYPVVLTIDFVSTGALKEGTSQFYKGSTGTSSLRGKTQQAAGTSNWTQLSVISFDAASNNSSAIDINAAHYSDGLYDAFPLIVHAVNVNKGLKGQFYDMLTISPNVAQGSRQPATGDVEKVVCGNTLVPLTAVPTL